MEETIVRAIDVELEDNHFTATECCRAPRGQLGRYSMDTANIRQALSGGKREQLICLIMTINLLN